MKPSKPQADHQGGLTASFFLPGYDASVLAIILGFSEIKKYTNLTTVRLLLKQNQLVRKFMRKLIQIGSVKQLI